MKINLENSLLNIDSTPQNGVHKETESALTLPNNETIGAITDIILPNNYLPFDKPKPLSYDGRLAKESGIIQIFGTDAVFLEEFIYITARSGIGKSWFSLGLAEAAATGSEFLENFSFPNKLNTGYIDTENSRRSIMRRWHKGFDHFKYYSFREIPKRARWGALLDLLKSERFDFIILDGLKDLMIDFNSVGDAADNIGLIQQIITAFKLTIAATHHTAKTAEDSSNGGKGHGGALCFEDCCLAIELKSKPKEQGIKQVIINKNRNFPMPEGNWDFLIRDKRIEDLGFQSAAKNAFEKEEDDLTALIQIGSDIEFKSINSGEWIRRIAEYFKYDDANEKNGNRSPKGKKKFEYYKTKFLKADNTKGNKKERFYYFPNENNNMVHGTNMV